MISDQDRQELNTLLRRLLKTENHDQVIEMLDSFSHAIAYNLMPAETKELGIFDPDHPDMRDEVLNVVAAPAAAKPAPEAPAPREAPTPPEVKPTPPQASKASKITAPVTRTKRKAR
jgi:hypothetical protein